VVFGICAPASRKMANRSSAAFKTPEQPSRVKGRLTEVRGVKPRFPASTHLGSDADPLPWIAGLPQLYQFHAPAAGPHPTSPTVQRKFRQLESRGCQPATSGVWLCPPPSKQVGATSRHIGIDLAGRGWLTPCTSLLACVSFIWEWHSVAAGFLCHSQQTRHSALHISSLTLPGSHVACLHIVPLRVQFPGTAEK
jgi:hypothetical protein